MSETELRQAIDDILHADCGNTIKRNRLMEIVVDGPVPSSLRKRRVAMTSPLDEPKSIDDILQLIWMDGAKLSGGSYANEPSINAEEAKSVLKILIKEVEPELARITANDEGIDLARKSAANHAIEVYTANLDHLFNGKE